MAEQWPASLEQKLQVQGFQQTLGNTVIKSETEIGLPKERRRFTKGIDRIGATIIINRTDIATFDNFYNTTLNGGILTFEFTDPISDTLKEYKFDTSSPPVKRPFGANDFLITMQWIEIP